MVCFGSHWDCSLLNTLLCWAYSCGILVSFIPWVVPIVALQSRIRSIWVIHGLLIVRGMKRAFAASEVLNMIGNCV